jgi:sugar (pentulose or hexulose) kinase
MKINTIFQLCSLRQKNPAMLDQAETMLMTPDLFNYFLTGEKVTEYSIASTSQLLDAEKRDWAWDIIKSWSCRKGCSPKLCRAGRWSGVCRLSLLPSLVWIVYL